MVRSFSCAGLHISGTLGLSNVIESAIREPVREEARLAMMELQKPTSAPSGTSRRVTPPTAAEELGNAEKSIRGLVKAETVTSRSRHSSPDPRQRQMLVNLDEVASVISRSAITPTVRMGTADVAQAAARIRARAAAEED